MTVQCLYQNDPKDAAAVLGQRNACRRAANKLGWLIQQERICAASEGTPLLLRPDVQELLRDVEQGGRRCPPLPRPDWTRLHKSACPAAVSP